MATGYDLSLSVVMHFGAKPCFFSSFRSNRLADRAQRRRWTRKSSTSCLFHKFHPAQKTRRFVVMARRGHR
jgi:hypothetical protein